MARRRRAEKREIAPDFKYNNLHLAQFVNKVMQQGKKTLAQRITYDALDKLGHETNREPPEVFEQAVRNAMPQLQVKPRRVGGATYQVPVEVREDRQVTLAMRWIIKAARSRSGAPMSERLAHELLEASRGRGDAVKRKDDMHRMAEANRAFAHYKW